MGHIFQLFTHPKMMLARMISIYNLSIAQFYVRSLFIDHR